MLVIYRSQIEKVRARKLRIAAFIHDYTGEWSIAPHPYIRALRFCWSSNAPRGTLLAKHISFNPRSHHHV